MNRDLSKSIDNVINLDEINIDEIGMYIVFLYIINKVNQVCQNQ